MLLPLNVNEKMSCSAHEYLRCRAVVRKPKYKSSVENAVGILEKGFFHDMERRTAKVSSDYHVRFDNAYYSVDRACQHMAQSSCKEPLVHRSEPSTGKR